jgi:ABC-type multidrug transport system fused ATPase/permease subunit
LRALSKTGAVITDSGFVRHAGTFIRDFAAFAGASGIRAAVLAILAAAFEGVGLVLLVPLLSIVTANDATPGWFHNIAVHLLDVVGAQTRNERLSLLLGAFAVLLILRALAVAHRDAVLGLLQMGFVEQIRSRVAQKLAAAPWLVVSRLQHARVTHLMSGDIQRIGTATSFMVQLFAALVLMAVQIAIAFALAPALTGIAVVLIALGAGASFVMLGRAHDLGAQLSRTSVALMHETTQFLGGLKLAAGQNRQADFVNEFAASLAALKRQQFAFIRSQSRSRLAATVISGLIGALIAFIGLAILDMPPAILIAMLLVFARISAPAMQVSQAAQQFANMLPAYAEVRALERDLAAPDQARPNQSAGATVIAPGIIAFRGVNLAYPDARGSPGALNGFDLTIEPGTFVGVSGPTGAGKTTLADLLVGLLEPQSGEISVGGTPLVGMTAVAWRDHVSYVVQDPYLFRDTIRRNLLWACPQASENDLWEALIVTGAADLVSGMESGLDTVLGERGTLVSGGERQRLCLARAVLRRPWLFVLDEATSAIDVPAERKILKAIAGVEPRPTIVMIAHRDESLASCDRVVRMENGRIVAGKTTLASA